jgi:glycosyltransferase involved in cell wall biosynthesis
MRKPRAACGDLRCGFTVVEPGHVTPRQSTAVYVEGWYESGSPPRQIILGGDGAKQCLCVHYPTHVPRKASFTGRFWGLMFADADPAGSAAGGVSVAITSTGGARCGQRYALPTKAEDDPPRFGPIRGQGPLVGICMATHNPSPSLFARQIESIRQQTHGRFVCLISDDQSSQESRAAIAATIRDDARFVLTDAPRRLGFFRNFERCMGLVPPEVEIVALSDQDDVWDRDKLATLVEALRSSSATLVYSDMRVTTPDLDVLAPSAWLDRRNNYDDLAALLMMNTVTGAAAAFPSALLADVLPFPPDVGRPFHDHWIASVALALGPIIFVNRPLQSYVQHAANTAGHPRASLEMRGGLIFALWRFVRAPSRRLHNLSNGAQGAYKEDVVRLELFARTLDRRLQGRVSPRRKAELRRVQLMSHPWLSLWWLLSRSARDARGRSSTAGQEIQLIKGLCWYHIQGLRGRVATWHVRAQRRRGCGDVRIMS